VLTPERAPTPAATRSLMTPRAMKLMADPRGVRCKEEVIAVSNTESIPVHRGPLRSRLMPAIITFFVAAAAIYLTAWVAVALLRHVVMPILAVVVAGYLAVQVYRFTGRER
jgi:hypothetical protein